MVMSKTLQKATVEATVIKADGTRVPLGVICEAKPVIKKVNPFKKLLGGK